jgi:sodium-independent sulfate anion transporter 11
MSLEVANIIKHIQAAHGDRWDSPQIATTIAFICGFITLGIGLLRIGWIVEFIPTPAVAGFMTGSAVTIASSQIPGLFGIQGLFDTRAAAYKVLINTLKNLKHSTKDAAFGVMGLFGMFIFQFRLSIICTIVILLTFFYHSSLLHPRDLRVLYQALSPPRSHVLLHLRHA